MKTALPRTSPDTATPHSGTGITHHDLAEANELDALRARCDQLSRQLVDAQRLSLLGEFALVIAHEFNNLLTPVVMRADAALLDEQPDDMRQALEHVITNVQRAIAFSARVLALGKPLATDAPLAPVAPQAPDARDEIAARLGPDGRTARDPSACGECDAGEAVQAALSVLTRSFEKAGLELSCDAPAGLRVRLAHELLAQVVLNLLLLSRERFRGQRGRIALSVAPAGPWIAITVTDASLARATPAQREALAAFLENSAPAPLDWAPFGLGLQVCRLIAGLCGGRLEIAPAAPGAGSAGLRALFPAAG